MPRTIRLDKRSNCLVFALKKWFSNSGYLLVRKSHFGWWPHFLWSPDIKHSYVEHYAPVAGQRKTMPPPLFRGKIQTSDKVHDRNESTDIYSKIESGLFIFFCLIVGVFSIAGAFFALVMVVPIYRLLQSLANRSQAKTHKTQTAIPDQRLISTMVGPTYSPLQRSANQHEYFDSPQQKFKPAPTQRYARSYPTLH